MAENWDIPWKNLLDRLLEPVLAIFFPAVHAAIDWSAEPENLETELQSLSKDAAFGTRRADKLFRVRLKSGDYKRLLLHIEVQTTVDSTLPERVLVYWYRIFDHYGEKPISLVILGDENPGWRPNLFREENLGFRIEVEYPIFKMLDFKAEDYAESDNPMVLVGVAYLKHTRPVAGWPNGWSTRSS